VEVFPVSKLRTYQNTTPIVGSHEEEMAQTFVQSVSPAGHDGETSRHVRPESAINSQTAAGVVCILQITESQEGHRREARRDSEALDRRSKINNPVDRKRGERDDGGIQQSTKHNLQPSVVVRTTQ
jgi:hypothetical protein